MRKRAREPSLDDLRVEPGGALGDADLPRAAVVVLNYNGRRHISGCFESLRALDYPAEKLSALLVDNGSRDDSLALMRAEHPWVRLVENEVNRGFSAGCNQGAAHAADADMVVFLNNDMRVEAGWLRALVSPIARGECAATTAKMLSWDGKKMNSAGGGMTTVEAKCPLGEVTTYARTLSSMTGGQGSYTMEFANYESVPGNVQAEVLANAKVKADEE